MKKILVLIAFLGASPVFAQNDLSANSIEKEKVKIRLETQFGGANFLGATINTVLDIPLSRNGNHALSPTFGWGFLMPGWDGPTTIVHAGLNYKYKKFGFGAELSGFTKSPFANIEYYFFGGSFVDFIVYPNANYTFNILPNWYINVSAGAYLAFSKAYYDSQSGMRKMEFLGDVIPGGGLSIGYKF
jgi:hypothetical protein